MTDISAAAKNYYQRFLDSQPEDSPYQQHSVIAEGWGDSPQMADELGALIAAGTKTATCSAMVEWEANGNALPEPGLLTVVLDGKDEPLCIIETMQVEVKPFDQVDAQFAYDEGEGDRSLAYWRAAHRRFFERYLSTMGLVFSEDMLLVCERFRLIYK
jgi:uncharacterized protein YhfF